MYSSALLTLLCLWAVATISAAPSSPLGLKFEKRAGELLPTLTLPYATYRAASYDPNGDVCMISGLFSLSLLSSQHISQKSLFFSSC